MMSSNRQRFSLFLLSIAYRYIYVTNDIITPIKIVNNKLCSNYEDKNVWYYGLLRLLRGGVVIIYKPIKNKK